MIKKRSRPQTRSRQLSQELEEDLISGNGEGELQQTGEETLDVADLIELRKLRRAREGIDVNKLGKGELKKKKKLPKEEDLGGLRPGAAEPSGEDDEEEDKDAKARRVVRANNFTQQTNVLDVDKHMMAYIEENMRLKRGTKEESRKDAGPADPYAELFKITDRYKVDKEKKEQEEGSVTNSMAMLTAIPEVDLGMDTRLKNIEETEKAKRIVAEEHKDRRRNANDEEHLAAARFYRPNLKTKSDAEILREAKLEALGLRADEPSRRPQHDRPQMATDELVMERFKKRMRK